MTAESSVELAMRTSLVGATDVPRANCSGLSQLHAVEGCGSERSAGRSWNAGTQTADGSQAVTRQAGETARRTRSTVRPTASDA